MTKLSLTLGLCSMLAGACTADAPIPTSSAHMAPTVVAKAQPHRPHRPHGIFVPNTTASSLAIRHLRNQIANYERMGKTRTLMLSQYVAYIHWLSLRARFLGTLSDYAVMQRTADQVVKAYPSKAKAYLLRARVKAGVHLFAAARADLKRAQALGIAADDAAKLHATLLAATGDLTAALAIRKRLAHTKPDLYSLGDLATIHSELGNEAQAERLFVRALKHYKDRSPFAVAWLLFQRGLMHERAGRNAQARDQYRIAYQRLPAAPLTGHLAGAEAATGNHAEAIRLLRHLVATTDDPDYLGQLGQLLAQRTAKDAEKGAEKDAATLIKRAGKRYDALTQRHMLAFADHAARFWLGPGNNAARALELAKTNLQNRNTDEAFQLVLDAAHAAKLPGRQQCGHAKRARTRRHNSAYLLFAIARAYRTCGRAEEATVALVAAGKAKRKR